MAQPEEAIVSAGELPRGAPPQAPSCCPITAMVIEMAAASNSGRTRRRGGWKITESTFRVDTQTSGAHLPPPGALGQTGRVTQGGRSARRHLVQMVMGRKRW